MKEIIVIMSILMQCALYAQETVPFEDEDPNLFALEDAESDDESNVENDYDLQSLERLKNHPVNLNGTDLQQLTMLTPLLINNLMEYRRLLGDLIDVHELQAVPGFTDDLIRYVIPFVTVRNETSPQRLKEMTIGGHHSFLIRGSFVPEKSAGFSKKNFSGSRPSILIRHKYQFRNVFQYGLLIEKDAGETFFDRRRFPQFTSFHSFARGLGSIKAIAIGDYVVNLGQGLLNWQGQAFNKSAGVINIKRQSEVLRPYHSAGEFNFNRGGAITIKRSGVELTVFTSIRRISGNMSQEQYVTSINTSGLHRTRSEIEERNNIKLHSSGASIKKLYRLGHITANTVYYKYSLPLQKATQPYNLFAARGTILVNSSLDYSYTYNNVHAFGEIAADRQHHLALVSGIMASVGLKADIALLYRQLSKRYQSLYGNAFTENSIPANEKGLYAGVCLKPHQQWKIDMYADVFSFNWVKYRLDAPSYGSAYLVQVTYRPTKKSELYVRVRQRFKPLNDGIEDVIVEIPEHHYIYNVRMHLNFQVNRTITLRSRMESSRVTYLDRRPGRSGYLFYAEIHYKPPRFFLSGNVRLAAFEAPSYDTRLYTYESDVLYANSVPSFYNNGVRYYVNLKGKVPLNRFINSQLTVSVKFASTVYSNVFTVGTGDGLIPNNRISAIRLQFFLSL